MPSTQPPSKQSSTPNLSDPQQPKDITPASVSDAQNYPISQERKPLSTRNIKEILAGTRANIADIKTNEDLETFCITIKNKLTANYEGKKAGIPARGELTTKQINKKRLLTATSVFWGTATATAITILVLSATAVIPYMLPLVIAVSITIALSTGIFGSSLYATKTIKPDIEKHTNKDVELDEAKLDDVTSNMIMHFLFDNKAIVNIIEEYKEDELQQLATDVVNLLEDDSMYTNINELFTKINRKIREDLDPTKKQDDTNWSEYQNLTQNLSVEIMKNISERTKKNITDEKIKNEIKSDIEISDAMNSVKLGSIIHDFADTFSNLDTRDSSSSTDEQKNFQNKLLDHAKKGLNNGFKQYRSNRLNE